MLKVQSLAARRGGRMVFRDVTFSAERGALLLVTGANGSGKSTLLRVLAGLLPASKGEVLWRERPLIAHDDQEGPCFHYLGHLNGLKPELTPAETLDYWDALNPGEGQKDYELKNIGLEDYAAVPVRYLSAGQRQRLVLLRLSMRMAPLWLLDEPATALDKEGQIFLLSLINRHCAAGGLAVMATHHDTDYPGAQIFAMKEKP